MRLLTACRRCMGSGFFSLRVFYVLFFVFSVYLMLLSSSLNSSNKNDIDVVTSKPPFISRTKGKPKEGDRLSLLLAPDHGLYQSPAREIAATDRPHQDTAMLFPSGEQFYRMLHRFLRARAVRSVSGTIMKYGIKSSTKLNIDKVIPKSATARTIANLNAAQTVLPVLVIACDRVTVKRCLDNLVKFRPSKEIFPIIVSQDCGHNATYEVIKSFTVSDPSITVVKQPDLTEIVLPRVKVKFRGYYKIARHYKFALNHVFETLGHEAVIIVEDDLDISPDFFEYFLGTYPLLLKDKSLWCISAWNDNGKMGVIDMTRPDLLHRTDFFPGLGWVLRRNTWTTLAPKWPAAFFDDWLRNPVNIEGRACIRPEISRTYSFGKVGVSKGLFFDMHLRNIQLNMEYVEFTKLNLTYLLKDHYDEILLRTVASLPVLLPEQVFSDDSKSPVRVMYSNAKSFQRSAKKLGLMDDFRSGVPRTAYRGIVTCYVRGRRVYLAPDFEWTKYNPSWG